MLFICFARDDHVVKDTLGVRYSLQNLVYGTLPDRQARGDAKNQPIVLEEALWVLIVRYLLDSSVTSIW